MNVCMYQQSSKAHPPPLVMMPPWSLWQATSGPPLSGPCAVHTHPYIHTLIQEGMQSRPSIQRQRTLQWIAGQARLGYTIEAPTAVTYGQEAGYMGKYPRPDQVLEVPAPPPPFCIQ